MDDALAWRIETACLNACPAARQMIVDGWLLRADGGTTRRVNSVNPLRGASIGDPAGTVERCEALYRSIGRRPLFRVTDFAAGLDRALVDRGYAGEGETLTLHGSFDPPPDDPRVTLASTADAGWLAARAAFLAADGDASQRFAAMLGLIVAPTAFATARAEGRIVALGCGVIDAGMLVLESIATDPAARGRGHGKSVVAALMRWAAGRGVREIAIQVVADNPAARALYAALGIDRVVYRYLYRRAPL